MGDVGEQGPKGDDELGAERLSQVDDQLAERAPAERRLAAGQEDEVARGAGHPGLVELDRGPDNLSGLAVDHFHPRARGLEVIELLRIDGGEAAGAEGGADVLDRAGGGV